MYNLDKRFDTRVAEMDYDTDNLCFESSFWLWANFFTLLSKDLVKGSFFYLLNENQDIF